MVLWHDTGRVPAAGHPESSMRDVWKKLDWSKNRVAKATPIKVAKSRNLNIGCLVYYVRERSRGNSLHSSKKLFSLIIRNQKIFDLAFTKISLVRNRRRPWLEANLNKVEFLCLKFKTTPRWTTEAMVGLWDIEVRTLMGYHRKVLTRSAKDCRQRILVMCENLTF